MIEKIKVSCKVREVRFDDFDRYSQYGDRGPRAMFVFLRDHRIGELILPVSCAEGNELMSSLHSPFNAPFGVEISAPPAWAAEAIKAGWKPPEMK